MLQKLLVIVIVLGGGIVAGGALAAFITLIKLIPRLLQLTETEKYVRMYENIFSLGSIVFTIIYFSDFHFNLPDVIASVIGIIMEFL